MADARTNAGQKLDYHAVLDNHMAPDFDVCKPRPARMYDYYLGGKDHLAADRAVADRALESWAAERTGHRENRGFLGRAVQFLVADTGVVQFLDVGAGLPTASNVHEIAQALNPAARVVYVDNDPLVLAHERALLTSVPGGRIAYVQADLRSPADILTAPAVRSTLDFSQPIALLLVGVLHFLQDHDKPESAIRTLVDALPAGSYLVASHLTLEHDPVGVGGSQRAYRDAGIGLQARDSDQFARLAFAGLEIAAPGIVLVSEWRRDDSEPLPSAGEVSYYGGVARKL